MNNKNEISVLLVYTGGTIGMTNDPVTGSLVPVDFGHISDQVPELRKFGYNISSVSFDPVKDSSDIDPSLWVKLATIIEENYNRFDGFVILHGTDTMAYTASALSFMLENLNKPIIFTGSQLPIGVIRTDGKENLITAIEIAASQTDGSPSVPEVCIYFDNKLMRGNRTTKISAEHFDAFDSPNFPPLAEAGLHIKFNRGIINYPDKTNLVVHKSFDNNIAVLKLFPGLNQNFVKAVLATDGLKALIIESFGSGNAPTYPWFIKELKCFLDKGGIVLNITQCHGGSVEMGLYETSREMLRAGVLSGRDITSEASVTKLMHLLGTFSERDRIIASINKPLAGEMT